MTSPSSPIIRAAEELELADEPPDNTSDPKHAPKVIESPKAAAGLRFLDDLQSTPTQPSFRSIPAAAAASSHNVTKDPDSAEDFTDVSLAASPIDETRATPVARSFFGFSMPSMSSTSETQRAPSSWRGTMSNLLSRSASGSSTNSETGQSAALLLNRVDESMTIRRHSKETGDNEKVREGFERLKAEMEGTARELRRERPVSDVPVDWIFWGAVVQDYEQVAREDPKQLSRAIQQGVPPVIRGSIWQLLSSSKSAELEEAYKALIKLPSPHEKAIRKDVTRTLPNEEFFQTPAGQESLFMVVKAYSLYDQDVGYTQGLAFIVAALLLNVPDEEAFCILVRLMDSYNLRSHFLADMPGLQLRLFQFDCLLEEAAPLLHTHFLRKGIKSSMYASQWMMTLFAYRLPPALTFRVMDIVFAEGIEALFRFSMALLLKSEERLLGLDFEQILRFLQTDLFDAYKDGDSWRENDFVRDAYGTTITPFMLDQYESEFEGQRRLQNSHAHELDQLRTANRSLSTQVKQLESSLSSINQEHVEVVRQLVMCRVEKEETENELVRYKMMYAELAHERQDAMSIHSRRSAGSLNL